MALHLKDEWENFVVEQLRGPYMKEFGNLKTDGERYKFCKYILRNNTVAQEIISQIQKLLSTRSQQKAKSAGNGQEYLHVGEEHLRRRDFKKAVICLSLAIQQVLLSRSDNQTALSNQHNDLCDLTSSDSTEDTSRSDGQPNLAALYTQRAEVLYQAQEYKACLNDIQEVISLQHPQALSGKLVNLQKFCQRKLSSSQHLIHGEDTSQNIPTVTGGQHSKIANGSSLIEISCTASQGRFLKASDDIRAGDTLISEAPYAAVLLPENALTHCECCMKTLIAPFPFQNCALLSEFLQDVLIKKEELPTRPTNCDDCTRNRLCQVNEQPHGQFKQNYIFQNLQSLFPTDTSPSSLGGDVVGCLLFHHSQQMACNVHAITAIVSTNGDKPRQQVVSREQKRIGSAIYPTASLLNHACDPDVIVSFVDGHLVVRATHNISKGSEISHCYGPHVSRMGYEDRQKLLYKQYFFTCQCTACKSDEEMENKRLCFSAFACPQCKHAMRLSSVASGNIGTCQNRECNLEKNMLDECRLAREAELLFVKGVRLLERVGVKEALDVFHECLRRRKTLLHAYNKDLAETHDAIARCYAMIGDFKKACYYCSYSCEAVEKAFGSSSVEYAHELHKLSQLLFNDRQIKKALSTIDKATNLLTRHYGRSNPDVKELSEMKRCLVSVGGYARNNSS
ncbi:uncharacterized protein LOC113681001 [Pocillopora damicornis]|uniref:uncharacterized protein LOC113681001 n=1 Tax=Pocillopora damicornis TaxID=46731 RepID=UPI000F552888|nr:uncharacterized protein LOC113681001 [Pocillopora damicornis]